MEDEIGKIFTETLDKMIAMGQNVNGEGRSPSYIIGYTSWMLLQGIEEAYSAGRQAAIEEDQRSVDMETIEPIEVPASTASIGINNPWMWHPYPLVIFEDECKE
jgi:hypothetical protein